MKKLTLTLFSTLVLFTLSFADTPPAAVQKAFEQKFGGAQNIKWGKEGTTEWEAEFTLKGQKTSANFTPDGTWVETENELPLNALPKAVADAIAKTYAGWTITQASKTETAKNGLIFEADLTNGKLKKEVAYKENGTPVKE